MHTTFVWLAETTDQSHRYAENQRPGEPVGMTSDPNAARKFATRNECLSFCCGTYARACLPPLHPVEHGFYGPVAPAAEQLAARMTALITDLVALYEEDVGRKLPDAMRVRITEELSG